MTAVPEYPPGLSALLEELNQACSPLSARDAADVLKRHTVPIGELQPFIEESGLGYSRAMIARTETYDLLVMTWRPGQASVAHDHFRSSCALKIVKGRLQEVTYRTGPEGLVEALKVGEFSEGDVIFDPGNLIHSIENRDDASSLLVTIHLYSPPLRELRRYAIRHRPGPPRAFTRQYFAGTPVVGVVGGGFSGTMVATHLLHEASRRGLNIHVALFDAHKSIGEGLAYRTLESTHLLNVPSSGMSVFAETPDHFTQWAKLQQPLILDYDFLPRRIYGEYVRATLMCAADSAAEGIGIEYHQTEITSMVREGSKWALKGSNGARVSADIVVLATGHGPPEDPFSQLWYGSKSRYISNPWATLLLSAIRPDETVALLGSGLTSVDVVLSLTGKTRSAPIHLISRRGLLPQTHSETPTPREDLAPWLEPLFQKGVSLRRLVAAVRSAIQSRTIQGGDWRSVVDGLRPHTPRIWQSLESEERLRFFRHLKRLWEVHRHRMAPSVGSRIESLRREGIIHVEAARLSKIEGTPSEVSLELRPRGCHSSSLLRADWLVNCTGPGSRLPTVLQDLVETGHLERDDLGLGVLADADGWALTRTGVQRNLIVVGPLRRGQLFESTAVSELRVQAANAAHAALSQISQSNSPAAELADSQ